MAVVFISLILLFLIIAKRESALLLFITMLPFHPFVKGLFDFYLNSGGTFAFWKELAIIILAFKTFSKSRIEINKTLFLIIYMFVSIVIIFYFLSDQSSESLAQLRNHVFSILLFAVIIGKQLTKEQIYKFLHAFMIGGFISCIAAFLQYFFFNIPISFIMGNIDFIDSEGYIQYSYSSARIMGIERMSGILSGPNDLGLYCSFIVGLGVFLLNTTSIKLSRIKFTFLMITTLMAALCLILSFSRAGWVIALICITILIVAKIVKLKLKTIAISGILIIIFGLILSASFPSSFDIIINSVYGKEASAAARGNVLTAGAETLASEPFGHGLGSADRRSSSRSFFVESAFLNITYEIGFVGILLLIIIHVYILSLLWTKRKNNQFIIFTIALSIASCIISLASINPYGMPYIYIWWLIIGLGLNIGYKKVNLKSMDKDIRLYG